MEDIDLQKYNAKFKNKASPCPVHVKGVHEQHQIELVNMRAILVNYKEKTYKYILSLIDVLSRFHWLCPLKRKHSTSIKKNKLEKIYSVHFFFPKILQSDNGAEFKKLVKKSCKENKIKMIKCRAYHPLVQRKVKGSQRAF